MHTCCLCITVGIITKRTFDRRARGSLPTTLTRWIVRPELLPVQSWPLHRRYITHPSTLSPCTRCPEGNLAPAVAYQQHSDAPCFDEVSFSASDWPCNAAVLRACPTSHGPSPHSTHAPPIASLLHHCEGAFAAGLIDEAQRFDIVRNSCPGAGACGGMYTANTMASAIEALGMALPYDSSIPAEDPLKRDECRMAGR